MIFDSHAHLISGDLQRYPPTAHLAALPAADLQRPFAVEQLLADMDAQGVVRAVLVQRSSIYGYDNSYVCDAAQRSSGRLCAVAAIDACDPHASEHLTHWVSERGAAGIRLMEPHRGADLSWLASENALALWDVAQARGVAVCVHFFRWNRDAGMAALTRILERWPHLTVVIDHLSNAPVESGAPHFGVDEPLRALMSFPHVYSKFTTIPLGFLAREGIDAAPLIDHVVSSFGAQRLMWGSDVTQSKGSYAYMVELARRATSALTEGERMQVLYGTAAQVYGRLGA
jgi:L-fuconolactonase